MAMSDTSLDALVLNTVFNTSDRLTPLELKRRVQQAYRPVKHGQIESSIKRLVEQKELIYTYQFGNSFLEPSFEKPMRVANSIILKPPNANYHPLPDDIVVNIKAGAAFGTGIGLDIDPCARAEASENAKLNGLSQQMEI